MPCRVVPSLQALFLGESSFHDHYMAQLKTEGNDASYVQYKASLGRLFESGTDLSAATRGRILAAAWALHDRPFASELLARGPTTDNNKYGIAEVLRACKVLDSARELRRLKNKQARLTELGAKKQKLGPIKSAINELESEGSTCGSLSGALARFLRKWARNLPADYLEFSALSMPATPWQEFADIVHLRKSDFALDWFLEWAHGSKGPEGSIIAACANFAEKPVCEQELLIRLHNLPLSFVRRVLSEGPTKTAKKKVAKKKVHKLAPSLKVALAENSDLTTILWWWEELGCDAVTEMVMSRIDSEAVQFSYGKTLERILLFKRKRLPFTDHLIEKANVQHAELKAKMRNRGELGKKFVVHGDASSSMSVAVNTATIFGSILASLTSGSLRFFNGRPLANPIEKPDSVEDVLSVLKHVTANGCTANAATLWESYEKKEKIDFHIQVTDEEENTSYKGYMFADLFAKYREEVYPESRVIFISFLSHHMKTGRMVREFEKRKLPFISFKLDGRRPDLNKLDKIISTIILEANTGNTCGETAGAPTPGGPAAGTTTDGETASGKLSLAHDDATTSEVAFFWRVTGDAKPEKVQLAGDWTSWQPIDMLSCPGGFYLRQSIVNGSHVYKFVVDGEWVLDPTSPTQTDAAGHINSVLEIKPSL